MFNVEVERVDSAQDEETRAYSIEHQRSVVPLPFHGAKTNISTSCPHLTSLKLRASASLAVKLMNAVKVWHSCDCYQLLCDALLM